MLVAKSELAFCSHARRLTNAGFAEVLGLTGGHRERLGGGAADFATSITVGSRPQRSPHFVFPDSRVLLDVHLLGKFCILDTVLRHHSLKSIGADASAEMQSGRSPLMFISLKSQRKK